MALTVLKCKYSTVFTLMLLVKSSYILSRMELMVYLLVLTFGIKGCRLKSTAAAVITHRDREHGFRALKEQTFIYAC